MGEPPSAPASGLYAGDPLELAAQAHLLLPQQSQTIGPVTFTLDGKPFGWPHPHGSQYDQFGAVGGGGKRSRGLATHVAQGFVLKFVGLPHEVIDFRFFHAETQTVYYVDLQHTMNSSPVHRFNAGPGPTPLAVSKTPFFPCPSCKRDASARRLQSLEDDPNVSADDNNDDDQTSEWSEWAVQEHGHRLDTVAKAGDDHNDDEHHVHPPPPPPSPPEDMTAAVVLWVFLLTALFLLLLCPLCTRVGSGSIAAEPMFVVVVPSEDKPGAKDEAPASEASKAGPGASVTDGRFVVSKF